MASAKKGIRKDPQKKFLVFECAVEGCVAEFYLNGIPITRRGPDLGKFYGGPCNAEILDGLNEIAIVINPGPTPGEALPGKDRKRSRALSVGAKASASLTLYPHGAVVGGPERKLLMNAGWLGRDDRPEVFPKVVTNRKDLGERFGKWDWQDAPRLELAEQEINEIGELVNYLHLSLTVGDPELLIETSAPRLKDIERAFRLKAGDKAALIRQVTEEDADRPGWGMEPLETDQFDFRLVAQDRLVEIVNKNWEPPLKELPDENSGVCSYSMMLAKLDGKWKIVR
jgi:hypothetical protein